MRASRLHLTRTSLLVGASVAALVVGTAAPGTAAGAKNSVYKAAVDFSGSVSANLTVAKSSMEFKDYASSEYYDRVVGFPGGGADVVSVAVEGAMAPCQQTKGALKGVFIYGDHATWASMAVGTTIGARVDVQCLLAGKQHIFHWGNFTRPDGSYDTNLTTNCVDLKRTHANVFTLTAPGRTPAGDPKPCQAQDTVINSRVQHSEPYVMRDMPFGATITVPGLTTP